MDAAILCYHGFSETWPAPTTVAPDRFERQLAWLAKRGYRAATLTEALTGPAVPRTVVFTFDDAHLSVLKIAAPMLDAYGFVGTVFAPTDYVDSGDLMGWNGYNLWLGTEHEEELRPMSWEQLGGLMEKGWEIGSHTLTHPHLTEVADDERLAAELAESRARCAERLGVPCPTLAYPYGYHDARVRRAASDAGYSVAVTMPEVTEAPLPMAWPRVGVYRHDDVRRVQLRTWRRSSLPYRFRAGAQAVERVLKLRRS